MYCSTDANKKTLDKHQFGNAYHLHVLFYHCFTNPQQELDASDSFVSDL